MNILTEVMCLQVYPDLDVRNIVEANEKEEVSNWCDFGVSFCSHRFTVRPFHCLGKRIAVYIYCVCITCFLSVSSSLSCEVDFTSRRRKCSTKCRKTKLFVLSAEN